MQAPIGGEGVCIKWYQSRNKLCEKEIFRIMPPRRRRDRPVVNAAMEEEMRQLCARLDAMETTQRRAPEAGDVSEAESEDIEERRSCRRTSNRE
jgi:hypothetical protein